jgi:hypothetical protein
MGQLYGIGLACFAAIGYVKPNMVILGAVTVLLTSLAAHSSSVTMLVL